MRVVPELGRRARRWVDAPRGTLRGGRRLASEHAGSSCVRPGYQAPGRLYAGVHEREPRAAQAVLARRPHRMAIEPWLSRLVLSGDQSGARGVSKLTRVET